MGRRGEDLGGVRVAASFCARTTRTISARREMLRLRVSCLLGRFTKRGSGEDIVRLSPTISGILAVCLSLEGVRVLCEQKYLLGSVFKVLEKSGVLFLSGFWGSRVLLRSGSDEKELGERRFLEKGSKLT
jgi:hypothetical protein